MVYQELSKLFAKEAFGQLHNWNLTSKEGKAAKAIAHGVVAEVSARMAGNKPGSGFYAGATNEASIGEIQKIAKEKPDVAQSLSALLGAAVNGSLGYSPVTGAPLSYTASIRVNMSYGLFVEYQKYKLLKEKKKEISMWGYKGLFLCWFIITLCIYTKIYILAWTNNRGYKEMSLNMCFPKLFKTFIVISYFYVGLLGYVFWFIDDFMIIMSSTILGVILIYLSGMIITIQKKSSPQYHNGKKLARYMLLYPFIAIVLYLWLKYNGLLF